MKFRAVWEDSSDTGEDDAEVEDVSLLDILPRKLDKGKGRQAFPEDAEDEVSEDGQSHEASDESRESTPLKESRSAKALVPTGHGDYVHPHEAETSGTRHTTPNATPRASSLHGMEVEVATPPPIPWPAQIGIEPHRVHVMQQSFFHTQDPRPRKSAELQTKPEAFLIAGKKRPREPSMHINDAHKRPAVAGPTLPTTMPRTARKLQRVPPELSITTGQDGNYRDLGLSMGRSFRVGWGPGGMIAHMGTLCGVSQTSDYESPATITVERIRMTVNTDEEEQERSNDMLATLSTYTDIIPDLGVPFASISTAFRFAHLVELFHKSDHTHEAELWRLCSGLFDEPDVDISHLEPRLQHAIELSRQKESLSDWLENCVKLKVESDLRLVLPGPDNAPKRLFALMTGNQIERACDEALDGKYLHLATLLAQTPEDVFREEILAQLQIWMEEKVEEVINPEVLKIYEVLGGRLITEGVNGGKLDWRRAFGLRLWYGETACSAKGIEEVISEYEDLFSQERLPLPIPSWLENSRRDPSSSARYEGLLDAHYLVMRLAARDTDTLDRLARGLSFSPSALDAKLPFFLSLILGRCLKCRDFSDRQSSPSDAPADVHGTSHMAGTLIAGYAAMLENVGCVKEAAFVLLFLELAPGRKKAIVELLSRHAHLLEGAFESELLKLQIPREWVYEAKTTWLLYQGEIFEGYESAIKSGLHPLAHNIAVNDLAPEVVLKGDMRLLRHLFARLNPRIIDGWSGRGKLYLDYANLIILLDQQTEEGPPIPDAVQATELARLTLELPKLIPLMPLIGGQNSALMHRAAVQQMATELLKRQTQMESLGLNSDAITLRKSGLTVDEGTRTNYVKAKAFQQFLQAVHEAV